MPSLNPVQWRVSVFLLPVFGLAGSAAANVKLPPVISEGMVLQRGRPVPLFGTAPAGEHVTVTFRDHPVSVTSNGTWRVMLPTSEAGGPFPLTIQGQNTIALKSVYVGEVWLCSGQSNMEWPVAASTSAASAMKRPPNEMLRLFKERNSRPQWHASGPTTVGGFSAVAYFFGHTLQATLRVPVGLIETSVGGTAVEQWTSVEDLTKLGFAKALRPGFSGGLHETLIKPLEPFAIRGAIWYQGESNAGNARAYATLFPGMIREWRREWGEGDFPFFFVQLARIGKPGPQTDWAELRDVQRRSLAVPHTAMAVCYDVSDGDIHPRAKEPIGQRLALAARALVYGEKIEYSGPLYQSAKRSGDSVRLSFRHAAGLKAKGGPPQSFEIGPPHGPFQPAAAMIKNNHLVLSTAGLQGPIIVRYGWRAFPEGNLTNSASLPASPFQTEPIE